jgi:hypothetical protein
VRPEAGSPSNIEKTRSGETRAARQAADRFGIPIATTSRSRPVGGILFILFKKKVTNRDEIVKNPLNGGIALREGMRQWNGKTSEIAAIQTGLRADLTQARVGNQHPVQPDENAFW